jgi:hypothetical protein
LKSELLISSSWKDNHGLLQAKFYWVSRI